MLKSKLSLSRHFEYANKQITYHFWLCTVNQVKSFKALADGKDVFIGTKTGSGIFAL
jgi:hypothetical protein